MSRFNLKLVAVSALAALASTACQWTDPVGPTTCVDTVNGDDGAAVQLWLAGYAQPVTYDGPGTNYWYDGWGNPIGWSVTEDSDVCVVLGAQFGSQFSPVTTNTMVWVDQPPVPQHMEEVVSE